MRMKKSLLCCVIAGLVLVSFVSGEGVAVAQDAAKPTGVIKADTTWSGSLTIDSAVKVQGGTLTIAPGALVTFKSGGSLMIGRDCGFQATGTADKPIQIVGDKCGSIRFSGNKFFMEYCKIKGMGKPAKYNAIWLNVGCTGNPVSIAHCEERVSTGIMLNVKDLNFTENDIRNSGSIYIQGKVKGDVIIEKNILMDGGFLALRSDSDVIVRDNILIGFRIWGSKRAKGNALLEYNYVRRLDCKGNASFGLQGVKGTIRNNVLYGGTFPSQGLQGTITNNVFISIPGCHEHICGMDADSLLARNIFVGGAYYALSGIGNHTYSNSKIINNTIDMRGGGKPIVLSHLTPKEHLGKNVQYANNILMRCGWILDHHAPPVPDTLSAVDYNLWADAGGGKNKAERYKSIVLTGKKPGEGVFGGHDIPSYADRAKQLKPEAIVKNPNVKFPFSDEDMISRKHTVKEVLAVYRDAYSLLPDSPARDAGDSSFGKVQDGKIDIGAIEFGKQ